MFKVVRMLLAMTAMKVRTITSDRDPIPVQPPIKLVQ